MQPSRDPTRRDADASAEQAAASDEPEPTTASGGGGLALRVAVNLQTDDVDPPISGWLCERLRQVAAAAGLDAGSVNLLIVDSSAMTELHRLYKGRGGVTDVLSFDLREDVGDPVEADIVICLDEAKRHAAERGHEARVEALLYATHGLLHVLGEDDQDPAGFERMHRREDELLAAVGVGPVFGRSERAL